MSLVDPTKMKTHSILHSVCLYTLVSDACEAALSKQSSGNPLEGGQALPPAMMTAALRSPSCSDDPLCKGL